MDLLAGYGSDASDSDSEQEQQAPKTSVQPPTSAPKPSFSSFLPPPKQSAPPTRPTSTPVNTAPAAPASSSLPSDFFDSKPATRTTNTALPADFFQQEAPAPSSPADPAPEVGPAKPLRPPPSFDDIPSTSSSTGGLWSKLPQPKTRKVITLNVGPKLAPLTRRPAPAPAPDADDDSPRPVKKSKPASKSALIDFLPAPKYSSTPTTFDFNAPSTTSTDPSTAADPAPGPSAYPEAGPSSHEIYSNEAYRADQPQQDYSYPAYDPSTYDASAYASTSYDPATYDPSAYAAAYPTQAAPGEPDLLHPGPNATAEEIDIFEAALKAERERVARTSGSKAAEGVKFVELNQQQLKYVHPAAQGTHDALKEALGSEYALQVRQEAKKHLGSKLARRRHQIGTLYHSAQVMELEMMEKRSQGMKSKKETAAKYGW